MQIIAEQFSLRRFFFILLCVGALLFMLAQHLAPPIKQAAAVRFVARGDTYFTNLHFEEAEREYAKAVRLDSENALAASRRRLAAEAPTDIAVAKEFFAEKGQEAVVRKIDEATRQFGSAKEALRAGVAFMEGGDYVYARYPLEQAVTLDEEYAEAWHYLAITYEKLAEEHATYREKAEEARARRDTLSPAWLQAPAGEVLGEP